MYSRLLQLLSLPILSGLAFPGAVVDAEFAEIANCSGSALWEVIPVE